MKLKISFVSVLVLSTLLIGCGGGADSESISDSDQASDSAVTSVLPAVDGYGIVTDIVDIDLNNDGYQDLLIFRTGEEYFYSGLSIQALINNKNQTFVDKSDIFFPSLGSDWKWIDKAYLVDLNGDGLLDIVGHIDEGSSGIPPLIRKPSGEFEVSTNQVIIDNMASMLPIDSDADGDIDILMRSTQYFGDDINQIHQWTLLQNNTVAGGELAFQSLGVVSDNAYQGTDYSAFVYSPVVVDINNDGYQDFVYGGAKWKDGGFIDEPAPLSIYVNSADNTFRQSAGDFFVNEVASYTHVREMVLGDFNNDGYQSILIANTGYDGSPYPGQRNAILYNDGSARLIEQEGISTTHNYKGFTHSTDIGDIDADGDLDIVYTDILGDDVVSSRKVRILVNDGVGNFNLHSYLYLDSNNWTTTRIADLNNDGYPDLILGAIDSTSQSIIFWNDGSGNF